MAATAAAVVMEVTEEEVMGVAKEAVVMEEEATVETAEMEVEMVAAPMAAEPTMGQGRETVMRLLQMTVTFRSLPLQIRRPIRQR